MASLASRSRCRACASPTRRSTPPRRSPCSSRPPAQGAVVVAFPELGPLGLHLRRPVPPARAARRLRGGARRASPRRPRSVARRRRSSACRCASTIALFNCAAVVARRPRPRRRAEDLPAELRRVLRGAPVQRRRQRARSTRCACSAPTCPFGADLLFEATDLPLLKIARARSARTSGCRSRRRATPRSPARRCWSTSRRRTSRSARPTTGTGWSACSRRAASRPTCTRRPGSANRPPTSAWDGQALIYESGDLLAESERFVTGSHFISADVDLERVSRERMRQNSFGALGREARGAAGARSARVAVRAAAADRSCRSRCSARSSASPTCRPTRRTRDERCMRGLQHPGAGAGAAPARRPASRSSSSASRAGSTRPMRCWSARAAMDALGLPRSNILAYTMPGFATSDAHARPGAGG